MKNKLSQLRDEFLRQLTEVKDEITLRELELKYLSRKGELGVLLRSLKDLSVDSRQAAGTMANEIKQELQDKFQEALKLFSARQTKNIPIDVTLPGAKMAFGHLHPITLIQNELEDLFTSLGFMILDGPELESDYYNFTALNVPASHPARDMQDTFYIDKKNKDGEYDLLLRTQTSPMQIRAMQKYGAPLKLIVPGRCFRNEATDARHEHTFYQMEGLVVAKDINFANLKSFLEIVGQKLFGPATKLRMRPKFFPFVEPGNNGEYTCFLCQGKGCRVCKNTGWLEIVGAGLVHPSVLEAGGLDPEVYSGLAFGFGLTRLAMLKYGINDVRFFQSGDLKFLEQF
ncbi:phenylalanine--tRNA ligase subunit alpha [Candidatus Falkowbacteria bacterium]|uniref:Phenylalanine--tRNA ligase alpha subunit n=1 Tax=Candidatus Falkowbacteria bacterium CG10_big_fil_rev_8_21_14_0_10_37_18 TaxID=1974562 RepID=A0A2H0V8Q2_9BACT|nr:phenylalanine--tRNA ligase subunit alpha [Candidatus Falkowbacteria bacterium]NCQ13022.1 phenylalanine--tRNA ligase subunit alpha [Candidatus Falkowbacteria bacterium]OIO05649.1 MAG: phenylalanine--tRNA ligase subunit alpha [Candidatus Falkowbacteria bacterium CG1_02_37_21]PIR95462.1 MAG: phenylalanine--tRNA ligase subunit alpha [Candidatus Falkowbacteria bacterium CG10_big_fil_rev_8_21_14_0_10_37_18]